MLGGARSPRTSAASARVAFEGVGVASTLRGGLVVRPQHPRGHGVGEIGAVETLAALALLLAVRVRVVGAPRHQSPHALWRAALIMSHRFRVEDAAMRLYHVIVALAVCTATSASAADVPQYGADGH